MSESVLISILAIFVAGMLAPVLHRRMGDACGLVLSIFPLITFGLACTLVSGVSGGETFRVEWPWVPSLGISLGFFIDGLSLLFLLVISGIGTFVVWYSTGYLHGNKDLGRFFLYLMGFMGAMLGIVVSDNLILLFIFWELTSITSYLLIGFYHESERSRYASLQALVVTGGGGLAMLAGLILLGNGAGTFSISELLALPAGTVTALPAFPWILGLVLAGAFTKSAQFPFHFWLPNAMEAPAPVSAFLHSATMVKAGVFLLARLQPILNDGHWWGLIVAPVGAVTMLTGIFLGLGQTDLKRILAYTTLAVLGTLTMLLGFGTEAAILACMAYLLAHALYKAALFMTAGTVDHETGTRDADAVGGLRKKMPFTAAAALVGALSMAGVPILLGFVSKEYFYKALLYAGPIWTVLGVAASIGMLALAAIAGIKPYWGAFRETPKHAHEAPWTMWLGPLILGVLAIKFGILPGVIGDHLIGPAASAVRGDTEFRPHLALWHGWNLAFALSLLTLAVGTGFYFVTRPIRSASGFYGAVAAVGPERVYQGFLAGLMSLAKWQTSVIQNGSLRNYILTVGAFAGLLIAALLVMHPIGLNFSQMVPVSALGVAACVIIVVGAFATCVAESRMTAILALGAVGLAVAVLFLLYSAPDLAMTQILVEALTVVLFVLAFYKLPHLKWISSRATRIRDGVIAIGFGCLTTALVLLAFHLRSPGVDRISDFMSENSYPLAYGKNVVNVILVDFRALDTLGEITVVGIAALGIYAMLTLRPKRKKEDGK